MVLAMIYSISSDQHCHDWSAFSRIESDGVNSRLRIILNELRRQAQVLLAAGGNRMYLAGDLLHVRGRVSPEVLNPLMDEIRHICGLGVEIYCIAGNHDLSTNGSTKLGNAMQALNEIEGFHALVDTHIVDDVVLIPWIEKLDDLRAEMAKHAHATRDLIIHAPLNGVIKGLPDHGLEPQELAAFGYRRVFVGHYHNHKEFEQGAVYSIGATTHQTWSDPDTKAGFLIVDETIVTHRPSEAPEFINITAPNQIIRGKVEGHYVRLKLVDAEEDVILDARKQIESMGALNWVDHSSKKRQVTRPNQDAGNVSLEVSVASYVEKEYPAGNLSRQEIAKRALDVLREARTVGE